MDDQDGREWQRTELLESERKGKGLDWDGMSWQPTTPAIPS